MTKNKTISGTGVQERRSMLKPHSVPPSAIMNAVEGLHLSFLAWMSPLQWPKSPESLEGNRLHMLVLSFPGCGRWRLYHIYSLLYTLSTVYTLHRIHSLPYTLSLPYALSTKYTLYNMHSVPQRWRLTHIRVLLNFIHNTQ